MPHGLMDFEEAKEYLKLAKSTFYRLLQNGEIPASKVGRQWRFKKEDIDKWLEESKISSRRQKTYRTTRQDFSQEYLPSKIELSEHSDPNQRQIALKSPSSAYSKTDIKNFFMERRQEERILVKKGEMFIKISGNFPKAQEIVSQVIDISSSGLSLKLKGKEEAILPGTPLKNIVVNNNKYHKTISSSRVRYCNLFSDTQPDDFRVGVEFSISPFEHSVLRRKLLGSYEIRMPRYNGQTFTSLTWDISFNYNGENIISHRLVNFSKFGIAFLIDKKNNLIFKKGGVLFDFSLTLEHKLVYAGKATIVNLHENEDNISIGCSLDGFIDLEKVFSISRGKIESEDIEFFISNMEKTKSVETNFKAEIADLRLFLEKTKEKLDEKERNLVSKNNLFNKEASDKTILDGIFDSVYKKLNCYFANIWQSITGFDENKYNQHKHYFQEQLLHLFLLSPFTKRSYTKPLGYAGDYKMIDMLYSNPNKGQSIFAKLINRHAYYQKTSQTVRNRIPYLKQTIVSLLKKYPGKSIKIMSVGSGPAREIQEMIKENSDIERCSFSLVEADEEAIFYSREKIIDLLIQAGKKVKVNFINRAVDQVLKEKDLVEKLGRYDLIYSLGLFDYFTLNVSRRLTRSLYRLLSPGGKLIIGNLNQRLNENKLYMDFILEWHLFYRSQEEMLKFTEKLEKPTKIYFESEDTGISNFLIIEK